MEEQDDRVRMGTKNSCWCEICGLRRIIWPIGQDVNSWSDPLARWVHIDSTPPCK